MIAAWADFFRARALQITLAVPGLRAVFVKKSRRLFFLFQFCMVLQLFLAIRYPIFLLIAGPALYGVPHLLASWRFTPFAVIRGVQSSGGVLAALITFVIFGWRLLSGHSGNFPELCGMILLATVLALSSRRWSPAGTTLLAVVLLFSIPESAWLLGILMLLHHLVAFLYWWNSASRAEDRKTVLFCAGTFLAVSLLILSGVFDPILTSRDSGWGIDLPSLGGVILPWSDDRLLHFRAVIAYAFGQSVHYFVWLKAIPDQCHRSEAPASFRQSLRLLLADWGRGGVAFAGLLTLLSMASWFALRLAQARFLYFALASFHGYQELAGLVVKKKICLNKQRQTEILELH